ncbi:MAG: hypothetical protein LAN63_00730 [Acidobacteriia bacterium]|nr:hypothetical protein [Terriglobia bacterium]
MRIDMPSPIHASQRPRERGVTILLVAVALVVVLGMAALAIDVVTLYVARAEAQRAADAAALAGAKAFVTSSFTSSVPGFDVCTPVAGTGGSGAANLQAQAAATQNLVAGVPATVQSISCNLSQADGKNPQISVTVQRTNLPTFFARIWGSSGNSVSASATAEAYNPSGSSLPVSVAFVKPFLIPNCNPTTAPGATCAGGYFVSTSNGALNNPAAYIGVSLPFPPASQPSPTPGQYYIIDPSPPASVCPGSFALPSGSCDTVGGGGVYDNIACANVNPMSCGSSQPVDPNNATILLHTNTADGARCLIHASVSPTSAVSCTNPNPNNQDCFLPGPPVTINGGTSNPNLAFQSPLPTAVNISRSDSVVTVPLYDGLTDLCSPNCTGRSALIVGFLQLGIQDVRTDGTIDAIVLNAAGCDPGGSGTAVSGGGVSPIPVRLIHN